MIHEILTPIFIKQLIWFALAAATMWFAYKKTTFWKWMDECHSASDGPSNVRFITTFFTASVVYVFLRKNLGPGTPMVGIDGAVLAALVSLWTAKTAGKIWGEKPPTTGPTPPTP